MRDDHKAKQRQFVFNPPLNSQPAKRMKHRSDMGGSVGPKNESGSIVLDLWEFRKKRFRNIP